MNAGLGATPGISPGGLALALAVFAAAVPVFGAGIVELADAWTRTEYSHGPVVLLMALWIGLRLLRDEPAHLREADATIIWPGTVLVGLGLIAGTIGTLARIGDVASYGLILWIAGVLVLAMGWRRAKRLWLPVAALLLALPLPQFIYWKVTTFLQLVASELAVDMIRAMGLSVYLDGNIIDLGIYRLQVAEACAGLQYLFPIISFAVLFAAVSREAIWRKVVLVMLAAPLAIGMNALRIAVTALLVDRQGIGAAEGFLHNFEGWVILLVSIACLMLLLLVLRAIPVGRRPKGPMLDLDVSGLGKVLGGVRRLRPAPRFIGLAAIGAVAAAITLSLYVTEPEPVRRAEFRNFPERIGSWPGVRGTLDPAVEQVIRGDDYLNTTYFSPEGAVPVQIFSVFYNDQTRGSAIHSPEICLPANGWEVAEFGTVELDMADTGYGRFSAIRAVVSKGTETQLVYYWFEQRGQRMVNDFAVKIGVLADGLRRGRDDGALVRFVTPISDEGGIPAAEARLRTFMRQSLPLLPDFVPF